MKYTDEKNILILISLLKKHNIKKIIASPGTTNISFVASIQKDPFFEVYSCVDERSACYMACGLAEESGEPVVLSCTGATASRNYIPGLTEAFYRKLPILAITSSQHLGRIGNNVPQVLDRTNPLNDIVKLSVQLPSVYSDEDEWACNVAINKAILELKHRGNGPAHINLVTTYSRNYTVDKLPNSRIIDRIEEKDEIPVINNKKVGIFVGAHSRWNEKLTNLVDRFCELYDAVVFCDQTSNYHGKYRIMPNIICDQEKYDFDMNNFDIIIDIGNISGAYFEINTKEIWRVNPDGEIRDTFKKLRYVFEMAEESFFEKYVNNTKTKTKKTQLYLYWKKEFDELQEKINNCDIPFSNMWIAREMIKKIPNNSILHLAILNSLRSWNYYDTDKIIDGYSNTGGFGIDGILSSLIGASFVNKTKNYYAVIGDLAFFYDLNSLGNRNIKNNLRILLINNGCGTEFHNYNNQGAELGEDVKMNIAADGHFGDKSLQLVKNFSENLGFEYLSASTKKEFLKNVEYFTSSKLYNKPIIFEVFTNSDEESQALKKVRNLKTSIKGATKDKLKSMMSQKTKDKIKKIIKK